MGRSLRFSPVPSPGVALTLCVALTLSMGAVQWARAQQPAVGQPAPRAEQPAVGQPTARADQPPAGQPSAGAAATPTPAPAPESAPVPQGSFLSSLTQAFKQDFEHQVVRGHFDVGTPPDVVHRYYCLVDAKSGKRQANGVAGEPFKRPDGMTGLKGTAVSLLDCTGAEHQGLLVTTGYVLVGGAAREAASAPSAGPAGNSVSTTTTTTTTTPAVGASPAAGATLAATTAAAPTAATGAAPTAAATLPTVAASAATAVTDSPPYRVDVAGVKLGMSVDEVRNVLKSKKLLDYHESTQSLGRLDSAHTAAPAGGYFVNMVAAWTPTVDGDGEAYEVMFTPVPGRERAMAIIHSVAYAPAHALRLGSLTGGLLKKYGGYTLPDGLPTAPTWRVQSDDSVMVGDPCKRRELFGGLADFGVFETNRPNLALKTTPAEFRYQIDLCGVAIVTEDHVVANSTSAHTEPGVTRFTVTAYSPAIGFEGATAAAQMMQAGPTVNTRDAAAPNL